MALWARVLAHRGPIAFAKSGLERSKGIPMSRFARKPASYSSAFGAPIAEVTSIDLSREKHYSIAEVAKLWDLSEKTIRRMFEHEPGVLCWGKSETRFRRGYSRDGWVWRRGRYEREVEFSCQYSSHQLSTESGGEANLESWVRGQSNRENS
jgi:hypothetical protein